MRIFHMQTIRKKNKNHFYDFVNGFKNRLSTHCVYIITMSKPISFYPPKRKKRLQSLEGHFISVFFFSILPKDRSIYLKIWAFP